ncbi:MAG: M13 family metallopeptidase [Bacillota bacterium]|nr:M13 family metallopeptidase [Bacillota bacterium]
MKNGRLAKRLLAGVLLVTMLTGCSELEQFTTSTVKPGQTISENSKWINSDIEGSIDENTPLDLKDDFHTAVNREWMLENEATKDNAQIDGFVDSEDILYDRKKAIILGEEAPMENPIVSQEQYDHNYELIRNFAELAGDWEERDALGIEPIRPYVEAIQNIRTLDDMTAFLTDADGMNYTDLSLISYNVMRTKSDPDTYTLGILPISDSVLSDLEQYNELKVTGLIYKTKTETEVKYLLGRLGYSEGEIDKILKNCYRFESRICDAWSRCKVDLEQEDEVYLYTMEELNAAVKRYPIEAELTARGVGDAEHFYIYVPDYLKELDKLYQASYLEEMKACWLVKTVEGMLPYLDREAYDKSEEVALLLDAAGAAEKEDEPTGQNPDIGEEEENPDEALLLGTVGQHLAGPLDQIYIAQHCTEQEKEDVLAIANAALDYYSEMLMKAEWLTEDARKAAVEKLDYMKVNAVYPNEFVDYTGLSFGGYGETDLVDAVKSIQKFRTARVFDQVGEPASRDFWDLDKIQTSVCNAYYMPSENSVNVLHGMLLGGFYEEDMTQEEKLGKIGAIIGHEITHAFDNNGYLFDKDGQQKKWWEAKDLEAFEIRAYRLSQYYSAIIPYPGAVLYDGQYVSGEAIADMGGMKCMLGIAEQIPDFDYERFFIAYAENWRTQRTFSVEKSYASGDEHPLAFLRTNVTLQQFDEFNETFDIQPGDGMYLAPEDRISVW